MAVALADSVLFSLDADAARSRVLLFLGISFVPFLFVAPLIGPAIDRMAGGRRLVVQLVTIVRVVLSLLMAVLDRGAVERRSILDVPAPAAAPAAPSIPAPATN
jgi:hypothetical protein